MRKDEKDKKIEQNTKEVGEPDFAGSGQRIKITVHIGGPEDLCSCGGCNYAASQKSPKSQKPPATLHLSLGEKMAEES